MMCWRQGCPELPVTQKRRSKANNNCFISTLPTTVCRELWPIFLIYKPFKMVVTIISSNYISEWAAGNTPPPNVLWNALFVLCQKLRSEIESVFLFLLIRWAKKKMTSCEGSLACAPPSFPELPPLPSCISCLLCNNGPFECLPTDLGKETAMTDY